MPPKNGPKKPPRKKPVMNANSNTCQNSLGDGVRESAVTLAIKKNAMLPHIIPNTALRLGIYFTLCRDFIPIQETKKVILNVMTAKIEMPVLLSCNLKEYNEAL